MMKNQIQRLKKEVFNNFLKYPKPKNSLSDAIKADNYGKPTNKFVENWNDWTEIKDWQVDECPYIFSYLPDLDVLYYVPRYIIWTLDDINGDIPDSQTGCSGSDLISWIFENKNFLKENLNLEQLKNIKEFLNIAYSDKKVYFHDFKLLNLFPDDFI